MEETKTESKVPNNKESAKDTTAQSGSRVKTREGSGYLRQLYSTARNTAGSTHSHFRNLTTFLVNFIPVDKVDPSELQVRVHFDDAEILALSKSIKDHGVLQPILVVQNGERYKVIAGERRLRASKLAGIERIPARVITSDDKSVHEIALRENLDRVDLHPIEEGEGYVSLLEAQAYTSHEAIAQGFMKPKTRISECIGFTRLPTETKQRLMQHNIKARSILRKLLNTPPAEHNAIIDEIAKAGEDAMSLNINAPSTTPTTGGAEVKAKEKREIKPFEVKLNSKGMNIPGFRWKVGEGPDRLQAYVDAMEKAISDARKFLK